MNDDEVARLREFADEKEIELSTLKRIYELSLGTAIVHQQLWEAERALGEARAALVEEAMNYGEPLKYPPERCPWCGAKLSGGGEHTAYYDCGAHIWTAWNKAGEKLKGHPGGCRPEGTTTLERRVE